MLVSVLVASSLALLIPDNPSALAWAVAVVAWTAIPLWGAVDATLRRSVDWQTAGRNRTRWVAVQGVGAPFGIGLVASAAYFLGVRRELISAEAARSAQEERVGER